MNAKFENVEKNKVLITVDVAAEDFEAAIAKSFEKNRKKYKINGFRDGKAPRKMVEQVYGIAAFYNDAFNMVIPEEYEKAVKELKLDVVSEPEFDITAVESNTKLTFTAAVFTKPEVVLGDYKGIEVKKANLEVTDEDVENELKKLAEEDFRLESVEGRPAENGDTVVIDYEGSVDGVPFDGGKAENHNLVLGSNSFIPGFEDQVCGHNIGEEFVITVKFPEDYHAENLKGKDAEFKIVLHDIKTKVIPEINDDFAAEKSDFDTLDAFKEDLKKKIADRKANEAKAATEDAVLEKATENAKIDVPECMIDDAANRMIENYRRQISNYGIKFEDYLNMTGATIDSIKADCRPSAEKHVRESLVLEAIANKEDLKPTDEQLNQHLKDMAEQYKVDFDKMMENVNDENKALIAGDMKPGLALDFLVANAKYVDEVSAEKPKAKRTRTTKAKATEPAAEATENKED